MNSREGKGEGIMKRVRPSNYDVYLFYREKAAHLPVTDTFLRAGFGQKSGGYLAFAETCLNQGKPAGDPEHEKNYAAILACMKQKDGGLLELLMNIPEVSLLNPCSRDCAGPSQKWHLYSSVFAQSLVEKGRISWEQCFRKYPGYDLKLWLFEAAGLDVSAVMDAVQQKDPVSAKRAVKSLDYEELFRRIKKDAVL